MRRANLWLIIKANTSGAKVLEGVVTFSCWGLDNWCCLILRTGFKFGTRTKKHPHAGRALQPSATIKVMALEIFYGLYAVCIYIGVLKTGER